MKRLSFVRESPQRNGDFADSRLSAKRDFVAEHVDAGTCRSPFDA